MQHRLHRPGKLLLYPLDKLMFLIRLNAIEISTGKLKSFLKSYQCPQDNEGSKMSNFTKRLLFTQFLQASKG